MVTRLKEVDAVTVGLGWTGAIMARELTKAGLNVVSLEKGQDRIPGEDFILPAVRDEVRYAQRLELMMGQFDRHADLPQFSATSRRCRSAASARFCRARASAAPASIGAPCTGGFCRPISASAAR